MKLLERHKLGKEIKEVIPVKSAVRFIYNVYMGKASEFAQDKMDQKRRSEKPAKHSGSAHASPRGGTQKTTEGDSFTDAANKTGMEDSKHDSPSKTQSKFNDRIGKGDKDANVNLVEWTYEYFQNRYGLKNVADKKFQSLFTDC